MIYTLGGDDADKFRVRDNGQIEVGAGTELDYETQTTYEVTVMAEDSFGESVSIMVTIIVTDVDEVPDVTGDDMAEYPEKGTVPVATYTAEDPEGADITSWTLSGDDADDFMIDGGVLTFKKSPDYEMRMGGSDGNSNTYEVTVQATDESNKVGMHEVTVEVTNVEEPGTVTLSALRPQSQTMFDATLTDPDGAVTGETWQWAKASSRSGSYTDIDKAIASSYTPQDADIGSYLRVTATYTDPEGSDKSAMERSAYKVQAVRGANNAPVFPDQDADTDGDQSATATRSVAENTAAGQAIGDPFVADDDDGDVLTYTLSGNNADSFSIDWATGQLMTKAALDEETGASYTVIVRATDPAGVPQAQTAGEANSDEITVTITVTDVGEPPAVSGDDEVMFQEVAGSIATALETYTGTDPDDGAPPPTWSVAGEDGSKFDVSDAGALTFKAKPDFEAPTDANKNNVYEVTVRAADGDGNRDEMAVKVTVENENEDGTVRLSRTQIRVGVPVTASLSDPDGSISGLTWQWSISSGAATTTQGDIEDANSNTYTPVAGDVGGTLTATASYTDGHGSGKSVARAAANEVAVDTRNRAPVFEDQDAETDDVQNESTTRKVGENTEALATDDAATDTDATADNVGGVITATDPDPNTEDLIYTLGGDDADKFRVRDNGQIEVGAGTELDYETQTTYEVTVMAEDSFGESVSIMVTIIVTDVDEVPVISVGGLAVTGQSAIDYAEKRTGMVATYSAAGPDAARATWSLGGDDAGDFEISTAGVLTFRTTPNYETPADMDGNNVYMVTVEADDGTYMDTHGVTVTVINEDEDGTVSLSTQRPRAGTAITATLTDVDGSVTGTAWQWAKATAMDGAYSNIAGATSNSYTPVEGDANMYLRATAMYTDGHGSGKSEMAVSANAVNTAPAFDVDTAMRSVDEDTAAGENIGEPIMATDDDTLTYTLSGTGASSFDIDESTGQLMTMVDLDYETETTYVVTVTATDTSEATDSVMVTITVINVDEDGTVSLSTQRPRVGTAITATLTDVDGSVTGTAWQWAKATAMDGTYSNIAGATSNSYTPVEGDANMYLRATAMYTDGHGSGKSEMAVSANAVNTVPAFDVDTAMRSVDENTAAGENIGEPVMATDADDDTLTYTLSGTDASSFDIDESTGQLMTMAELDYETETTYVVTVTATDTSEATDSVMVTITVTNVDEDGTVTLSSETKVGVAITATLVDVDGGTTGTTWQWARSDAMDGTYTNIAGATLDSYTPVEADENMYLRATAMYTDGHGSGKSESMVSANAVIPTTGNSVADGYDANSDGEIDRTEVGQAVRDFIGRQIEHDDVVQVIAQYFKDLRSGS